MADTPVASATEELTLDSFVQKREADIQKAAHPEESKETQTAAASEAAPADKEGKSKTETTTTPKPEAAKGEDESDENLPPGARKRIDKLTARAKTAEEELQRMKAPRQDTDAEPAADPEPKEKDFKTWEEWNAAHARWLVRDEQRQIAAKSSESHRSAQAKQTFDAHLGRVKEYAASNPEFTKLVESVGEAFPQSVGMAIVDCDNGPQVMEHLAKHPDELKELSGMSVTRQVMAIGRLSASLLPSRSATQAPPTISPGKAPEPITPLTTSTPAQTPLSDPEVGLDDFVRRRNASEAKQRRR